MIGIRMQRHLIFCTTIHASCVTTVIYLHQPALCSLAKTTGYTLIPAAAAGAIQMTALLTTDVAYTAVPVVLIFSKTVAERSVVFQFFERGRRLLLLITGHIGLNHYLHRFNVVDSPTCPCCKTSLETVAHFLLHCPTHAKARDRGRTRLGRHDIDIRFLLTTKKGVRETIRYVNETRRLHSVFGLIPELPMEGEIDP
ncbi:hypothetical protein E1B28_007048 [Marasmius oreades]|uniref:Reverse transcriptase zinc-binding domain-containing protein n=1 Tax=Marasmius oreades TaxID=181124 RepID=A0A9P7S268_9AGAR|nr:uncharacterized protein E1B28_007048 [Marasmius oreades]KAG7093366.1 hypothetical protein E1B28_007048 [Marasmius oreades]